MNHSRVKISTQGGKKIIKIGSVCLNWSMIDFLAARRYHGMENGSRREIGTIVLTTPPPYLLAREDLKGESPPFEKTSSERSFTGQVRISTERERE